MFVLQLAIVTLVTAAGGTRNRRDCRYEFKVWTPNEDEQRRLEHIELQFANVTNYVDKELARNQVQRLRDAADVRNWTSVYERALTELKAEQLLKYTELQELKIKFGLFELSVERLKSENHLQNDRNHVKHYRKDRMVPNHSSQADTPRHHMLESLKQLVADLKAEWILLKRDFISMKNDNSEIRKKQGTINDSAKDAERKQARFESILASVQSMSSKLSSDLSDMKQVLGNLNKDLTEIKSSHQRLVDDVQDQESGMASLQASSVDMRRGIMDLQMAFQNMGKTRSSNEINTVSNKLADGNTPRDCQDIADMGFTTSGMYRIKPGSNLPLDSVYCDIDGAAAYTVIQRRVDGLQDFNRGWLEYKFGFGNLYGEFWFGNEQLHALTSSYKYRLRVDLLDWEGNLTYAEYDQFRVADENSRYELQVSGFYGNAGDSLSYHNGMKFSTKDLDNDIHNRNCAAENKGGWWFNGCYFSHLNGVYHVGWYAQAKYTFADGIVWYTLKDSDRYSLRKVEMKIKRV